MQRELLKNKYLDELKQIAKNYGVANVSKYRKDELIDEILRYANSENKDNFLKPVKEDEEETSLEKQNNTKTVCGIIDITVDGYGFLRSNGYDSGEDDIYVSPVQIRRFHLRKGDKILGLTRESKESEKFSPLIYLNEINAVSYTHLRAHETKANLVCRLLLEKKKKKK